VTEAFLQCNPVIIPSLVKSMFSAAGFFGRGGIMTTSPMYAMLKLAPAAFSSRRTNAVNSLFFV